MGYIHEPEGRVDMSHNPQVIHALTGLPYDVNIKVPVFARDQLLSERSYSLAKMFPHNINKTQVYYSAGGKKLPRYLNALSLSSQFIPSPPSIKINKLI